jgi:hypothetical protein
MSSCQQKRSIVIDEETCIRRVKRSEFKKKPEEYNIMKMQRLKEKQILNQWKADRDAEKKTRFIARSKSRDISKEEKQLEPDSSHNYEETPKSIWKHENCTEECAADDCLWWKLEAGLYC